MATSTIRILTVDDDELVLGVLRDALTTEGYDVVVAASAREALDRLAGQVIDVALLDIRMPGMSGLDLLRELKRRDPGIEAIMTTANPDVDTAVEALKDGAADYLQKPLNLTELRHRVRRVLDRRTLQGEVRTLRRRLGERLPRRPLVGSSPEMAEIRELVSRVAMNDSAVLIEGESGTGKEIVAAAIHRSSPRADKPFIPVNCGAIPDELLESELFGHVRGAFTGAVADAPGLFRSAHGGTIFLDEIADLPLAMQAKLLRVLQEREVRPVGAARVYPVEARVIAATNRHLQTEVDEGRFRADLFYRLNVVDIAIPPLRERRRDIPDLVTHFLGQFNERYARTVQGVAPDAMALLMAHPFPGNVRELENLIERAYALGATGEITAADLAILARRQPGASASPDGPLPTLAELERDLIVRALERYPRNKEDAARAIGISARTMYRRLKEYGLDGS